MDMQDELFRRLKNRSNRDGNMTKELGLTVTEITAGTAVGSIRFVDSSVNPRHLVHGGALFGVMDQLAGLAACTTGYGVVTINGTIEFLRPTKPAEPLTCTATVLKPGRRFTTCEAVITSDISGKLISKGTFTYCMMEELKRTVKLVEQSDPTDEFTAPATKTP